MYRTKTNKQSGFTIIEVMIVLAVAGLIMAIVFLAIPALQRSNRNTQRKNDATRLAGLVAEFQSNNNGKLPANVTTDIGSPTWSSFDTAGVTIVAKSTNPGAPNQDEMKLVTGAKCNGNTLDTVAGTARQVVVWWGIEPSGTQCLAQ